MIGLEEKKSFTMFPLFKVKNKRNKNELQNEAYVAGRKQSLTYSPYEKPLKRVSITQDFNSQLKIKVKNKSSKNELQIDDSERKRILTPNPFERPLKRGSITQNLKSQLKLANFFGYDCDFQSSGGLSDFIVT